MGARKTPPSLSPETQPLANSDSRSSQPIAHDGRRRRQHPVDRQHMPPSAADELSQPPAAAWSAQRFGRASRHHPETPEPPLSDTTGRSQIREAPFLPDLSCPSL